MVRGGRLALDRGKLPLPFSDRQATANPVVQADSGLWFVSTLERKHGPD